jgi:hypothetical protein
MPMGSSKLDEPQADNPKQRTANPTQIGNKARRRIDLTLIIVEYPV